MRLRALLVMGVAIHVALPAYARDLTIALQASGLQMSSIVDARLRQALFQPFTASTGTAIAQVPWSGELDALHPAGTAPLKWDIVEITEATLRPACDQGLLEKLDWGAIGGRDHYLPAAVSDCGVGAYVHSVVLAWNPQKFPGQPSWADFWDVAKVPGKRGLARQARDNLEIALLADGVAPGDVYAVLRTNDGVDRAFRKLDQLRPYLVWWGGDTDPTRLLASGDVLMSSAPAERVSHAPSGGSGALAVQWGGGLYSIINWAIVKGTANLEDADRFLMFAGDPARQQNLLPLGSVVKAAPEALSAEQRAISPTANLTNALHVDGGFWRDNGTKLEARFHDWLGH
jgi:putative spermidine/putrescine transport system substrate-binding protein